jgi:mannosyltransferase
MTVPLGVVVIFPLLVVILILVLFVRHPSSDGDNMAPGGAPPTMRYAGR